jgi:hypothetical protein
VEIKMNHRTNSKSDVPTTKEIAEKVVEVVKGEDEPMSRKHPNAPAGLVFLTFPAALIAILLCVLIVSTFWNG